MRRYQDIIETTMTSEINSLYGAMQSQNYNTVDSALAGTNVLNMLNTRYIIINPETQPIINSHALGNAWFVNNVRVVENADADVAALSEINLSHEITLDRRYEGLLEKRTFPEDSTATIQLTAYQPNRMEYSCVCGSDQLAVFSEIFYEKGWQAYVDGEPVDHFRANYLLRGMVIPEGTHEVVFEFRPRAYFTGTTVSVISSLLVIFLLLGAIYLQYRKSATEQTKGEESRSMISV
jgi:hypothetical protein